MAKVIKEIEGKLKKVLPRKEEVEIALLAARQEMEKAAAELKEAESRLAVSEAAATAGGWIERRAMKKRAEEVAALRARLSAAQEEFKAKRIDAERLRDEVGALRAELAQPFIDALRKRVIEVGGRLHAKLADAVDTEVKELAALYQLGVERTPRRIVSQRVRDRFWRVHCPAMEGLYPDTKPPGTISMEPIKAMNGERRGKWTIAAHQDLSIRPEEIETQWGDAGLPMELEMIRERLDLGVLFSLNGKKEELSFARISAMVTAEDIAAAARAISEGV